ncbi:hypothetical protein VNI00_008823 [Paramarasmius palmivorus]|uniref:Uncharacterized protein n=1 Tax=Paramarasmius palmivorus TaxID=297713 RepID=A0AAW0CRK6_9AGAR
MSDANVAGTSRVLENMKPVLRGVRFLEVYLCDMAGTETNLLKKIDKACPELVSFQWDALFYGSSLGGGGALGLFKGLTRLDVTLPIDVVPEAILTCGDTVVEIKVCAVIDHETFSFQEEEDEHLDEDDDPEASRCVLASLRTLQVAVEIRNGCKCRDQGTALAKILEKISTPNLREVDIGLDGRVKPRCGCAAIALMRLLLRMDKRESLESLRLRRMPLNDDDGELLEMLRAVPRLRELVVEEMEGFRIVSERLLAGMKGLTVVPNLRRLDLLVLHDWRKSVFEDMIRSREKLKEIKLRIGSKAERLDVNKLKRMELEVMKVVHDIGSRAAGRGQLLIGLL